jgi:hypothetical protein
MAAAVRRLVKDPERKGQSFYIDEVCRQVMAEWLVQTTMDQLVEDGRVLEVPDWDARGRYVPYWVTAKKESDR